MAKKTKNLKDLSAADLEKKLAEIREEIRTDRFKMEGAKSKNVKEIKYKKREVARVLTLINKGANK